MTLETKYNLRQSVTIDGSTEIKGVILAICVRGNGHTYEVAWMHNGASYSAWIEEFRLGGWDE